MVVAAFVGPRPAIAACPEAVVGRPSPIVPASYRTLANVPAENLRITFAGHASFFIESPQGATVFTDYNDAVRPPRLPDIVTMNRSHQTHFTNTIEAGIRFVLRGWDPGGGMANHNIRYKDVVVRSVPTNIAEFGDLRRNENSIFVIETVTLCVAHLSHLHHVLSAEQLRLIGEIDVLFVPIDGAMTMSHAEAFHVISQIKPRLILPMHYGFGRAAAVFAERAGQSFPVRHHPGDTVTVSRASLPAKTEVLFLQGY